MGSAGDDGVVDRLEKRDEGSAQGSFDPGIETGYLRRAARDHELDPELGAAPFDPGAGAGYDDRRARKEAKRHAREERARREREQKENEERERRRRASLLDEARARPAGGAAAAARGAAPALGRERLSDLDDPVELEQAEPAPVTELRALRPQRRSLAERLKSEREERERIERERRAQVEGERIERERAERERIERRRRDREERLLRDRDALPVTRRDPTPSPRVTRIDARTRTAAEVAIRPVAQPATKRRRGSRPIVRPIPVPERPRTLRRRELAWPTAKAGFAVTIVLGVAAALGSLLGLPVPGLDQSAGQGSLVSSATLFGVGPGTPPGLAGGYVFPVGGPAPHDYGEAAAKFGADRYGHTHEGQDVFATAGTPLFAVRDGIVVDGGGGKSYYAYGGGNSFVMYSPTDDRSYVYLHMLQESPLHAGEQVHAGQFVGKVGCTGSCDGPHLHFEIRQGKVAYGHDGKPLDPLPYLQQWEQFGAD
jgi:murein DD-endopeptidase MepM/ murein hydrolase activator NlpD